MAWLKNVEGLGEGQDQREKRGGGRKESHHYHKSSLPNIAINKVISNTISHVIVM